MLSWFKKAAPTHATINGQGLTVQPRETLLQAALRQGVDFPHSCRVGGCGACKCRLVEGRVKALTQAACVLSDDELDAGMVLACQAVPQGDVRIEVDLSRSAACRSVSGRVVQQERLTPDIVRLRVQLDEALPYKAGQFAQLSFDSLPGLARSYSFANAPGPDAQVSFFVRCVPGGRLSGHVHGQDHTGQRVSVQGPLGDFWLRPADAPLLMAAGGSGLAPILAILQDMAAQRVARPVTVLFGARTQADLYAQAELAALAARWPAAFRHVAVLSEEPAGSDWRGERGLVHTQVTPHLVPGAHAYLCGPPPMVDAIAQVLRGHGVAPEHIHTDRFTTLRDATE
ncbi:MAG: hypothetical protein RI907_3394 [Pseudomonadota bacterium]|jgi:3-phenylpropionate/trans-cinnamate dioxygenase ferredoxin reductase subunit